MIGQIFRIKLIAEACLKKGSIGNFSQRISQCFKGAKNTISNDEIDSVISYIEDNAKATIKHLEKMKGLKP